MLLLRDGDERLEHAQRLQDNAELHLVSRTQVRRADEVLDDGRRACADVGDGDCAVLVRVDGGKSLHGSQTDLRNK